MSNNNNLYNILNNFNKVAQDAPKPATSAPKAKSKLQESIEQVNEKYMGFKKVAAAAKAGGAEDPGAVAASIGRKKYGKEKFQKAAAAGKKLGEASKPDFLDIDKDGDKKEPMKKAAKSVKEVAPPGAKAERMVKHIKKGYAKDGKLTDVEKSKAYGAAWKAHSKGKVEEAIQALLAEGWTTDQIVEGWDDMMKSVEKKSKEKGTGKFDSKKTSTGTVYSRKYDPKTGETDDGETGTTVKRGRGRPKKSQFEENAFDWKGKSSSITGDQKSNFNKKTTSTGTVYSRKYDPKTGETAGDAVGQVEKRGRGRPKKTQFESHSTIDKMIKQTFTEGAIQGGVWTASKGNVPVPTNPEVAKAAPAAKPNMGSAAAAMMAPNKVDPKAKVIPSDPEGVKEAEDELEESLNQMRRIAGLPVVETKAKKADKDYDGDGKIESGKDEYQGSKINAAKKAGKLKEDEQVDECMSPIGGMAADMQQQQGKMNISTNMSSDGNKSVTITADGDAALELMQMLKLAGMGGEAAYSEEPQEEPVGVAVVTTGDDDEGEKQFGTDDDEGGEENEDGSEEGNDEEVDEEKDERYHASTTPDEQVSPVQAQIKGGDGDVAGQEKKMTKHGYQFGDNPQAMRESAKLMREYESIKVKR
jgi:hypothetical protein